MDILLDYLTNKWPNLLIIFFYLILYFPVLVLNSIHLLIIIFFPILLSIIYFVTEKNINKYIATSNILSRENLSKSGYSHGVIVRKMQKYLTDAFPLSYNLVKKFLIIPLQKMILDRYTTKYTYIIEGLSKNEKEDVHNNQYVDKKEGYSKWNIYLKIIYYPVFLFISCLFSLLIIFRSILILIPIIIFVLLVIFLL